MSERLIIDARRHLNWNRRLFSDGSTLLLWSAWLWLCRSLLLRLAHTVGVALGVQHHSVARPYPGTGMPSIEDAVFALLGTCSLLMLWNRLASQPAPTPRLTIHAHPTMSEAVMEAAAAAMGEAVHIINR